MIEACIYFIVQQKNIDHFIVGVDSYEQLENIIAVLKKKRKKEIDFSQFSANQNKLIDPRNWKKI